MARGSTRIIPIDSMIQEVAERVIKKAGIGLHGRLKAAEPPIGTPVVSANLIESWQLNTDTPGEARVFTIVKYAPAVMYGENMPPNWNNEYKPGNSEKTTGTKAVTRGYPDLILKEVARKDIPKLIKIENQRR